MIKQSTHEGRRLSIGSRARATAIVVIVLSASGLLASIAGGVVAHSAAVKRVRVADYFFSPKKLTIKRGQKVKWVWDAHNSAAHNVTLIQGPKGAKPGKFASSTGATGVRFERKFTIAGTYHFECTIHPIMQLKVIVKK